jgi:hypothetical protein
MTAHAGFRLSAWMMLRCRSSLTTSNTKCCNDHWCVLPGVEVVLVVQLVVLLILLLKVAVPRCSYGGTLPVLHWFQLSWYWYSTSTSASTST